MYCYHATDSKRHQNIFVPRLMLYERIMTSRLSSSERNLKRFIPKTWLVVTDLVLVQLGNIASLLLCVLSLLVIFVFKVPRHSLCYWGKGRGFPTFF